MDSQIQGRSLLAGRITELDGVRAIAVILVFLNHFAPTVSLPRMLIVRQIGWVGVDIFFVLSGFLIAGILLDSESQHYYRDFYIRRSLRIFPVYYALLMVVVVWMMIWNGGHEYNEMVRTWGHPVWLFLYLGNVKTALSGVTMPFYLVPIWSLHVEEQFYVLFPFLIHRLSREGLFKTILAAVVSAPVIRLVLWCLFPTKPLLQYLLLPCRMDGLALGALIALRLRMEPWRVPKAGLAIAAACWTVAGCAVFILGGRRYDSPIERTLGYSLFVMAFACGILWIILFRGTWFTNWLNIKPLQFVGKISYGLYLFQMPVYLFLSHVRMVLRDGPEHWSRTIMGSSIVAITCVMVATLSWYLFEEPILRFKNRLAPGSRDVAGTSTSVPK